MLNKVRAEDESEVRVINWKCEEIITKLYLKYNDRLEKLNRMICKRLISLEGINDECHRYIGELNQEVSHLEKESIEKERSIKNEISFYIERAEKKEEEIIKKYKELQDNTLDIEKRYKVKIQQLDKVITIKTEQLIMVLKDKG